LNQAVGAATSFSDQLREGSFEDRKISVPEAQVHRACEYPLGGAGRHRSFGLAMKVKPNCRNKVAVTR
jgi:hypothetical protein